MDTGFVPQNHANTASNLISLFELSKYPSGKDLDIQQGQLHQIIVLVMRGIVVLHLVNVLDKQITSGQSIEISTAVITN